MISVSHCDPIMLDNDYYYLDSLRAYLSVSDGNADLKFNKTPEHIVISITPSKEEFKQDIIRNVLALHRLMGVKIIFSKSLKISKIVSYSLPLG